MDASADTLLKHLNWRYATKRFDPTKEISESQLQMLLQVTRLAPSSYGLQPWRLVVVKKNKELRSKLRAVSWNQPQIEECSHLCVFTARRSITEEYVDQYVETIAHVRSVKKEELAQYRDMMVGDVVKGPRAAVGAFWAQRQAYIAIGFLLEAAALAEIDACPMEGFSPEEYDNLLGLQGTDYGSVALVALGYRSEEDHYQHMKKVRFDEKELIKIVD